MNFYRNEKVVNNVTTVKKKYVKPDFEIIELNMEAQLLSASREQPFGFESNKRHAW